MTIEIARIYGNKIRLRSCGLLERDGKFLMIRHEGLGPDGYFWGFPGGGPEPGETFEAALMREFKEETGLHISVTKALLLHEFIAPPLHALEMLFLVESDQQIPVLGIDPELNILSGLRWFTWEEICLLPSGSRPSFINKYSSAAALINTDSKARFV